MADMVPILISLGFFAMIVCIVAFGAWRKRAEAQARADVQTRLLDKFGTSKEFVEFLQTDNGRAFLSTTHVPGNPREKILTSLAWGMTIAFAGIAFIVLSATNVVGDDGGMMVPGVILTAVGAGILLSAFLSYRLTKAWGMFDGAPRTV